MATTQQTTVLDLPHTLTQDEKLALRDKVISALGVRKDLKAELVSANNEFKRRKTDIEKRDTDVEANINKLLDEIAVGVELRKYKVNIMRDRDRRKVDFVVIDGPLAGQVVKTTDFTQDDWNATLEDSEPELPFDSVLDDEPQDLRSQADLTAEREPGSFYDIDQSGNAVAGPNTDDYNMHNADSPYQHLSDFVDFNPIVPTFQQDGTEPTDATQDAAGEQSDDDQGDDSDGGDNDSDDDGPSGDDEPQTPNPPRRKARRTGDPK